MDSIRTTQALLRHLDASLSGRPEDELIAQVLGGAEPPLRCWPRPVGWRGSLSGSGERWAPPA
jgi:hypothetical protein